MTPPTNNAPHSAADAGNVEIACGIDGKLVVWDFHEPVRQIRWAPKNLLGFLAHNSDLAFEADTGLKPVGETLKAELIERNRVICKQRYLVMLNSLRDDKTVDNDKLAEDLTDAGFKVTY